MALKIFVGRALYREENLPDKHRPALEALKAANLTDAARAWLGRVGYDPVYGARPLKRAVQKYLQDPLADLILRGEVRDGSTIRVDEGDGALKLTPA